MIRMGHLPHCGPLIRLRQQAVFGCQLAALVDHEVVDCLRDSGPHAADGEPWHVGDQVGIRPQMFRTQPRHYVAAAADVECLVGEAVRCARLDRPRKLVAGLVGD